MGGAFSTVQSKTRTRWLSYGAGLTAVALVVNGSFNLYVHSGSIPAFLLFLLWTLLSSVVLIRKTQPERVGVKHTAQATS